MANKTKETFKVISMFLTNHDEYGQFYSTNQVKKVSIFGLEGGTATMQIKGQKTDKQYTVWLNDHKDMVGCPEKAYYVPEIGVLARNKKELNETVTTLNSDRADNNQFAVQY